MAGGGGGVNSTRNSGRQTLSAAETISKAVGAEFLEWNVDKEVDGYVRTVSHAIGRELDWQRDDVALQNIQARARGPGIWLLANLRGALLLTTSNRSEAAVGYATMDGDTCGGLAPMAPGPCRTNTASGASTGTRRPIRSRGSASPPRGRNTGIPSPR